MECALLRPDSAGAAVGDSYGHDFIAGGEIHATISRGLPCGSRERSRVDAAFLEVKGSGYSAESWLQFREVRRGERGRSFVHVIGGREEDCALIPQIDFHPRL